MASKRSLTDAQKSQIRLLRAFFDWRSEQIAAAVGVDVGLIDMPPRSEALAAVAAENLCHIHQKASEGSAPAMRLMRELIEHASAAGAIANGAAIEKLGKKASATLAAGTAGINSEWGTDLVVLGEA